MTNGKKKDWLTTYLEYTGTQESPIMFHMWVGASVIASTLGRKVSIDRGYYTLYPNLYTVLVGASARVRKTTALNVGYSIFKEACPDACVLSQKITPEALIQVLVARGMETGASDAVMISSELSVFLGNSLRDDSLIQLLTKLYDCEDEMDYHTIVRGKEVCEKVCFNLIGATTPEWIKTSMPAHAVGGGFTSRIIFVYQFESERKVPFPHLSEEQKGMRVYLVEELKKINLIEGEFKLTKDARDWYEEWYCNVFNPDKMDTALDGYYGRKHDSLLKVAMVMATSRGSRLMVDEVDLQMALKALNENEKYLPEIMRTIQSTQVGEERGKVLRTVSRKSNLSWRELLGRLSYCMNSRQLNEVVYGLIDEGVIREDMIKNKRHFTVVVR